MVRPLTEEEKDACSWLDSQFPAMISLLETWANINSGSLNVAGLKKMSEALHHSFSHLHCSCHHLPTPDYTTVDDSGHPIKLPLGQGLRFTKHPKAKVRVFLCGHMDTVYGADSPFQRTQRLDEHHMKGPGVADLKGGLVVMLYALKALEMSTLAGKIGWDIVLNPDEELGSPSSAHYIAEAAKECDVGLIFEPSLPDGSFVSARGGSFNFAVVAKGKAAHVGRHFTDGRNAVVALARLSDKVDRLNNPKERLIANVGRFHGGGPVNVVPDHAVMFGNIRASSNEAMNSANKALRTLVAESHSKDIQLSLTPISQRAAKPFDAGTATLFKHIADTCALLNLPFATKETGGVCDGNVTGGVGLPTIDTLGVRGDKIHTTDEYVVLPSLLERAKLTTLFLLRMASGEIYSK